MHNAYLLRQRGYDGWLAGWLSVTCRYSIKTAKPILKLFRPYDSRITLVSSKPCADPNSKGRNPFSGGVKYTGVGKIGNFHAIFEGNGRLSRKRCQIGRWLVGYYGTLIGSHGCRIEWYHFRWSWVTLTRVSRSLYIYKSNISQMVLFRDNVKNFWRYILIDFRFVFL